MIDISRATKKFVEFNDIYFNNIKSKFTKSQNVIVFVFFNTRFVFYLEKNVIFENEYVDYLSAQFAQKHYIKCKIYFDRIDVWSSSIRIEIKLFRVMQRNEISKTIFLRDHLHFWVIRFNFQCEIFDFIIEQYNRFLKFQIINEHEQFFKKCDFHDDFVWERRQKKILQYVQLRFDSTNTQIENILVEFSSNIFFIFQYIHNHLRFLFDDN